MARFIPINDTYINPIDLNQLDNTFNDLRTRSDAAIKATSDLDAYLANLDLNEKEDGYRQRKAKQIHALLDMNDISGFKGFALNDIVTQAGKIASDPVMIGKLRNQKEWKAFNAQLDNRQDISDRDKDYYKEKNPYNSTIKYDSNGNAIGTETWTPNTSLLATPEYDKIFLEAIQIAKPDIIGGGGLTFYDDNGNATNNIANAANMSYYSKTTGKKTYLSKEKIWSAIKGVIDTRPDFKEMIERDYDITDWYNTKHGRTTNTETRDHNGDPININDFISAKYDPLVKAASYIHNESDTSFHEISAARRNANNAYNNPYSAMYNGQFAQTEDGLVPLFNSAGQYSIDPTTGQPIMFNGGMPGMFSSTKAGTSTSGRGSKNVAAPGQTFGVKDFYKLNAGMKSNIETSLGAETIAANKNNNSRADMQTAADNLKQLYAEIKGRKLVIPLGTRIKFTQKQFEGLSDAEIYNLKAAAAKYNAAYDAYQDYKTIIPEKDRGTVDFIDRMNSTGEFNINASNEDKKFHSFIVNNIFKGGNSIRISMSSNDLKENFRSKISGQTLKNMGVKVIDDDTIEIDRSHIANVMPILNALKDSYVQTNATLRSNVRRIFTLGIANDGFEIKAYDRKGNDLGISVGAGPWKGDASFNSFKSYLKEYNDIVNNKKSKIESQVGISPNVTVNDTFNGEPSYYSLNLRNLAASSNNPALMQHYYNVHEATRNKIEQLINNGSFNAIENRMSVDDTGIFREVTDAAEKQKYKELITQCGVKPNSVSVSTTYIKDNRGNCASHTFQVIVPKDDKYGDAAGKTLTFRIHGLDLQDESGSMFFESNYANATHQANVIGRKAGISKVINETNLNRNLPYAKVISGGEGSPWKLKVTTNKGDRITNISKEEAINLMGDMDSYNDIKYKILQQGIRMTQDDATTLMSLYPTIGKLLNLDYTNPRHLSIIEQVVENDIYNKDIQDIWH